MPGVDGVVWRVVALAVLVTVGVAYHSWGDSLRTDLRSVGRQTGVGWRVSAPVTALGLAGFASVFALGGTTDGSDLSFALSGAVFFLGLFGVMVAAGNYRTYRLAAETETTRTDWVNPGLVEVDGEAQPADEVTETPFSGTEALCYRWRVEEYRDYGRRSSWTTVAFGDGGVPFSVDDGSGPVLVDPDGADRRLDDERSIGVDEGEAPPDEVGAFVSDHPDLSRGANDRRYVESYLPPGADAYVLGRAISPSAGEFPGETVVITDGDGGECFIATGSAREVTAELERAVEVGGIGGAVAAVVGYAAMLVVSGAL